MSSSDRDISDSQVSNVSNLSLGLSQETMNQVLGAVGLRGAVGDRLLEEFHAEIDEEEDEMEEEDRRSDNSALEGPSTISISRAVLLANSQMSSEGSSSQFLSSPPHLATATPSTPIPLTPSTPHSLSWSSSACTRGNGVSPTLLHSLTPPPTSQIHSMAITPPLHHLPTTIPSNQPSSQYPLQSPIPQNVPFAGAYNFTISLDTPSSVSSKTANMLYSSAVQRMFIKKNAIIPITFSTSGGLPPTAYVYAMAIHKQPEMIAEYLQCCAKHVDELRKKGMLHPFHFIRSPMEDCRYLGENVFNRLRISLPATALQRSNDTLYTALYQFPCFTSDFQRAGQLVQLIFTLESGDIVHGRATLDIRVCASPGRDRSVEEGKARERVVQPLQVPTAGRKRVREEVRQCTFPPKKVCRVLSDRKEFTIETFPEMMPHVRECVKLLERVYMVPIGGVTDSEPPPLPRQDSFPSLESWLDSVGLSRYLSLLTRQGVRDTFQVLSLTDSELKAWGMTSRDRARFLQEAATLQERPNTLTPSLLPSSQLSQNSTSTQPFLGHFEVLQIQARKTINA